MTPRIPRGWVMATERGEGVWCAMKKNSDGWGMASPFAGPLDLAISYIRRTDDSVPADPNECLRLEDEAAREAHERKPDDAVQTVPGMMLVDNWWLVPLSIVRIGGDRVLDLGTGCVADKPGMRAAYTAAWEYTERRRAEIAEEVRRGGAPTTEADRGEWPGRPEVPPGTALRIVEVLTPMGAAIGYCRSSGAWVVMADDGHTVVELAPTDVRAWRELPRAIVVNGRVTGVTRG